MSIPVTTYQCSGCELSGSPSVTYGLYKYCDDTVGEIPLTREMGICEDCEKFTAVESFDDVDTVRAKIDELEQLITPDGWWGRFLLLFSPSQTLKRITELGGLNRRLALIGTRKGTERCLVCGGTNIVPFTGDRIGFIHPKCGGEIILQESDGLQMAYAIKEYKFTIDGDPRPPS